MSAGNDESTETLIAFVSGALIAAAATLLVVRMRRNKAMCLNGNDKDYCYDGGDLFI